MYGRCVLRFQFDNAEMIGPFLLYGCAQSCHQFGAAALFVGQIFRRNGTVEDYVGVGRAGHDAQVMQVGLRFQTGDLLPKEIFDFIHVGVAGDNGIVVDGSDHTVLHQQVLFDGINDIMALHHIALGIHFNMEADQAIAGAVIVNHQIMDAQHTGIAKRFLFDVLHQFRVRCGAQDGIDGVPYQLNTAINNVYSRAGYDTELIAFVDSTMYSLLMNTNEIARQLVIGDFKKGEINTRVRYLNDVAIIPVSDERMRDSYTFEAGTAASSGSAATGGFKPASSAGYVRALVVPKKGAHLVKKTEQMRIFTPEQNIDADAYTFNYRIHYDVFVKKSGLDMIESIVTAGA